MLAVVALHGCGVAVPPVDTDLWQAAVSDVRHGDFLADLAGLTADGLAGGAVDDDVLLALLPYYGDQALRRVADRRALRTLERVAAEQRLVVTPPHLAAQVAVNLQHTLHRETSEHQLRVAAAASAHAHWEGWDEADGRGRLCDLAVQALSACRPGPDDNIDAGVLGSRRDQQAVRAAEHVLDSAARPDMVLEALLRPAGWIAFENLTAERQTAALTHAGLCDTPLPQPGLPGRVSLHRLPHRLAVGMGRHMPAAAAEQALPSPTAPDTPDGPGSAGTGRPSEPAHWGSTPGKRPRAHAPTRPAHMPF